VVTLRRLKEILPTTAVLLSSSMVETTVKAGRKRQETELSLSGSVCGGGDVGGGNVIVFLS
jgi:hypothetical protein